MTVTIFSTVTDIKETYTVFNISHILFSNKIAQGDVNILNQILISSYQRQSFDKNCTVLANFSVLMISHLIKKRDLPNTLSM